MIYLVISIIALVFAGLRLIVATVNYLFSITRTKKLLSEEPLVSVLIPARNEEKNIGNLLDRLYEQNYQNLEIIVLDDNSEDRTSVITMEKTKRDKRIRLMYNDHVPEGWSGKNNACHLLAHNAAGSYLLFLDSDISIRDNIISEMVQYMKLKKLVLVSIFPKQLMQSFGERITVPNMNWILLSLLPLVMVQLSKRPSLSAANGQFMLFDAETYHKIKPHQIVKSSLVEDIEMMQKIKKLRPDENRKRSLKNRYRTAVLSGDRQIECRMYNDFNEAVHGFSKNVLHFFGNSLIWTFIFLFLTGPVIIFILLHSLTLTLVYLLTAIMVRVLISLTSKQNIFYNILLSPLQQLSLYYIVYRAIRIKFAGSYTWKGRTVKT
ncbi:MAG: glycosyltransferase family 2 protein [Bacteroidales bacterium]|nr:glycosyltransferase family 2 protein [Bacteroidales bacterium]